MRECRQLAYQVQKHKEEKAPKNALIGALIGAAIGSDSSKEAKQGALIGGAIGGAGALDAAYSSGKTIVSKCLRNRGHNVLL